jgi:dihydroflavonol-4-reductase
MDRDTGAETEAEPSPQFWLGKRVCVTGGTGLLGYQIVRRLLALGAQVRVLALPPRDDHPVVHRPELETAFGDVRDPMLVRRAVVDCDVIFHTAGVVAVWGPALARVYDVQVAGTRNVLASAPEGTRVVHTSSVVTVGAAKDKVPLDEDSPFRLDRLGVDYVHAKRAAEQLALEAADEGRDVVVTNPAYLIGPEDHERSVMGRFCKRFWRGQVPLAPPGGFNLVDVRDVARGHLLAAERGRPGRRYILGGENRTFPEFMAALADVAGLKPRAVPVAPWWVLAGLALFTEGRSRLTGKQPYPSWQHVLLNRYYWFYRSDRARRELGYSARPLSECLADTHRWCAAGSKLRVRGPSRWWMRTGRTLDRAA